MLVTAHPKFKKHFTKRILPNKKLTKKFHKRLAIFLKNPKHPLLKDHSLIGKKNNKKAFSITGDIRVIYFPKSKNHIELLDIGTHNQVY